MKHIESILEWVWLDENEAKIYLALLETWSAWITQIASHIWAKRTTLYSYIQTLLKKSAIKRTIKWKRILFTAEEPKALLEQLEEKKRKFLTSLPFLEWMHQSHSPQPHIEYYEGKEGVKKVYHKVWSSGEPVLAFFSPSVFLRHFTKEYDRKLWELEKKHGGSTKNLLQNDLAWKEHLRDPHTSYNSKLLPKGLELSVDMIIVKNTIVMVSYDPLLAVTIKNKAFADFHRNLFHYLWKTL